MAAIKTMHALFLHEMSDQYSAEQQLSEAMGEMLKMAADPRVKAGLERHIAETAEQIKNLERAFASLDEKPEKMTCKGAAGIIAEFKGSAKDIKPPELLDGFIVGGGLKGEHYEIESYKGLVEKAELMGHAEAAGLLRRNLAQEERFAEQLQQLDKALGERAAADPELVGHPSGKR
jgi:ferritin-like metal-binding protein YciE